MALSGNAWSRADPSDIRVWRFAAGEGVFDVSPVAGVWRVSQMRDGKIGPLAILALGSIPIPGDPWYDAAANLVTAAVGHARSADWCLARMRGLPGFVSVRTHPACADFWIDDWEVHELHFTDIQDLADQGFGRMLVERPGVERV